MAKLDGINEGLDDGSNRIAEKPCGGKLGHEQHLIEILYIETMNVMKQAIKKLEAFLPLLVELRRNLHENPELSGTEANTAKRILGFFSQFDPDEVISKIGGHGLAFLFKGQAPGPTVIIRCELDALPIAERNDFEYRSTNSNISHACGHNGHMTIVAGLGHMLANERPKCGQVVLLYQPAEETGEGAERVVQDPKFRSLDQGYIFTLHNLPGYPLGSIVVKSETFSCASRGMIIRLTGLTSHAAWPEHGSSPAIPMCQIIEGLTNLPSALEPNGVLTQVTVVYSGFGEPSFGTSPGYAKVMATLRTETDESMTLLVEKAGKLVQDKALSAGLGFEVSWNDKFVTSFNHKEACCIIEQAARSAGLDVLPMRKPLRSSEDFGHFTSRIPGAMFGVGAGEKRAQLHTPYYDCPEEIIPIGTKVFLRIIHRLLDKTIETKE